MDTLLVIRDSVATCVNKTDTICQSCVKEAETTWQDVSIALIICLTIMIIALYAIYKYFKSKKEERDASQTAAKMKRDNDVEDRQWKLNVDKEAHELKRKEDREDSDRKRKEEQADQEKKRKESLQDDLLCFLKDFSEINRNKDDEEINKYNENSKDYRALLEKLIS